MTYQSKEPNYIARREEQGLTVVDGKVNPTSSLGSKETDEPTEEDKSDAVPT
jgi:hypothetical protein